jgi:hypothetical protein
MPDTPLSLSERLLNEGKTAVLFFQRIKPEQWDILVYSEGAPWKLRQVLAHFVATETSMSKLVTNIASGGPGSPEDFNIDAFNARKVSSLQDTPVEELIQRFENFREITALQVSRLTDADLVKTGRHPFLGIAPLVDIIKLIYRHNLIHIRDMRRVLGDKSE